MPSRLSLGNIHSISDNYCMDHLLADCKVDAEKYSDRSDTRTFSILIKPSVNNSFIDNCMKCKMCRLNCKNTSQNMEKLPNEQPVRIKN